ncbi:glycosyltransferase family 2 protein [Thermodesulforhabdus norvegica]|uniref:Glucosylglycerate synthase n=1 Tax=Thermodesulforhabdus norvegica TaxID=39841 RepID=A0A1I4SDT2_9BACT|nr:glycosyltransferase [Thermodesulforhabdus norvegica]SFM62656.1 glucosylglycerate synthase [Thermodesulforhabdus norvegica]
MAYIEENPRGVDKAEIVVAIPTFNEASNIRNLVVAVDRGLKQFYGDRESVIINCDNHSLDGTRETFLGTETETPKIYISTAPGEKGKGRNIRNLFDKARLLDPQVIVILEADIRNIAPRWIYCFVEPVLRGAGFVTPLYASHKYEDTMEALLLYPLLRSLYGRRLRRPIAGECAFGKNLLDVFTTSTDQWTEPMLEDGIDIWMAVTATATRVPVCQTVMGSRKIHRFKDPYSQINRAFTNTVGVFFDLMTTFQDRWTKIKWSKPTILFNADALEMEGPVPVEINTPRLFELFARGVERYHPLLEGILNKPELHKIEEIKSMGFENFSFPSHTWANTLFDVAVAYRDAEKEQKQDILNALLLLYYGKVVSFVKKTERMSTQQAEEIIDRECMTFEENKRYLVTKWKSV